MVGTAHLLMQNVLCSQYFAQCFCSSSGIFSAIDGTTCYSHNNARAFYVFDAIDVYPTGDRHRHTGLGSLVDQHLN